MTFASACEYLIKRHTGQDIRVSQLFIYFNGRILDHGTYTVDDDGATRKNVVKGIRRFGICKEEVWPFQRRYLNKKPPDSVYDEAKRTMVTTRQIPLDITAIRLTLAKKLPAIVGIKIQDGVFNEASNNGGHLFIPDPSNVDIAHAPTHAVLVVGYDDRNQQFIVRNSWGSHWVSCESVFCMRISSSFFFQGDQGYFYMPYDYLLDERLVNYSDGAWIITGIERKAKHHHPHRH